jgi:hypothetical protein
MRRPDYIELLMSDLDHHLSVIAATPRIAKEVLSVFPISNRKSLRWTRERQLLQEGSATLRRGQLISVPAYSVQCIEMIMATPGLIEWWRQEETGRSCLASGVPSLTEMEPEVGT